MYHGQKRYIQLLLDPARAALLDGMAQRKGVRTSALVRDMIYDTLEQTIPPEVYRVAVAEDEAVRATSLRRQRAGRKAE